jgi:hypothetical protein
MVEQADRGLEVGKQRYGRIAEKMGDPVRHGGEALQDRAEHRRLGLASHPVPAFAG